MKDSLQSYFHVGTIQWMSHPKLDALESIKKIACDPFFSAIEIGSFTDLKARTQARDMLRQANMKVCYGAQPRLLGPQLNPNDLDETRRLKAEITLKEAIDEAEFLGAKSIAFLAGKWSQETRDAAYEQLLKTTRNVCAYAASKDMIVEMEVFDYDMDKAVLIGPAPLAARFASDMRSVCNNFGLLVDLSHFPTTYESSRFVVQTLRPYITHFHIGNAVVKPGSAAYGDLHPRFGFPNSANDVGELIDFFQVLKEEGFFRKNNPFVLSFEVKPWADEDADLVLAGTKRFINKAWAMVED